MNLQHGDDFEIRNAGWLRDRLPDYEKIWQAFIGKSPDTPKPLEMPGLSLNLQRSREEFYQAHYSFARKLLLLERLSREIVSSFGEGATYEQFVASEDRLFRFGSYLGFIYDMFEKMAAALKARNSVYSDLQRFYCQRHHIIHTPLIPHMLEGGLVKIPRIAAEKGADGEWHKASLWSDFEESDFVFLSDFVSETTSLFFDIVRSSHARIFDAADSRFGGRRVEWQPEQEKTPTGHPTNANPAGVRYLDRYSEGSTAEGPASATAPNLSGQFVPPARSTQKS